MKTSQYVLPLERFYWLEAHSPQALFLRQPIDRKWHDYSYQQVGDQARKMAQALIELKLPARSKIALLSKNCSHWIITDLAIWMAGHISVPLYPTLRADTIQDILEHSEAKLIFIGKLDEWEAQKKGVPSDLPKICFPFWPIQECRNWDDVIKGVTAMATSRQEQASDVATIIYTSGTTGRCKGVVHSFGSISYPLNEIQKSMKISPSDRFLSYLPLSHIAERFLVQLGCLYAGGTISFAESLDTFASDLRFSSPTVFLAVPRIWLKFQQEILKKVPQIKLDLLLKIPVLSYFVKRKIRKQLGLNDVRFPITGAAPISIELLQWFDRLGIKIQEVYGMTENFGFASFNFPWNIRLGTIGQSWEGGEIKIDDNGEILTRSKATMVEYYKDPTLTRGALDENGWLHTGDKGVIDTDGFLKITGRVKDMFKTAKGKYVSPAPIENYFSANKFIDQVCVVGAGLPQPMALVIISDLGKRASLVELVQHLEGTLDSVNGVIESYERIEKIVMIADEWSVNSGILTPTLKIKRTEVETRYTPKFESWYSKRQTIFLMD